MLRPLVPSLNEKTVEQARELMLKLLPEIDVSIAEGQYIICTVMGYIAAQKQNGFDAERTCEFVMNLCGESRWRISGWMPGPTLHTRVHDFVASISMLVNVM